GEVLKTPGIERAPGIVTELSGRVKAAFAPQGRGVPPGYLEEQVEAMLLEGRCYRKTTILGGRHLKGMFRPGRGGDAVPAYLVEDAERGLPALGRCEVRLIAEARVGGEGADGTSVELEVVALARRVGPLGA